MRRSPGPSRGSVPSRRSVPFSVPGALALLLGCSGLLLAACVGDGSFRAVSRRSGVRPPAAGDAVAAGADPAFCDELRRLSTTDDPSIDQDPAAAIEALSSLGDLAPPELTGDFTTLAGVVQELSGLDQKDPNSFENVLGAVLSPEVTAASDRITAYARSECGVDLQAGAAASDSTSTTVDGAGTTATAGDLNLEDVDAVERANASASWPDKLSSTSIVDDTVVELAADDAAMLTADEALAACTAVREALVVKNPQVTLTVKSGSTVLVKAPAGAGCAPA